VPTWARNVVEPTARAVEAGTRIRRLVVVNSSVFTRASFSLKIARAGSTILPARGD
jgi:hypothetical protein